MPRTKLTKSVIDALPTPEKDVVYWDQGCPGFGVKVTPKGRTLHQARDAAQKIFAARLEGRDPAVEKREARRRTVADGVGDLLEAFIARHVSQNRSAPETSRLLRREFGTAWSNRSIHEIKKRDVIEVVSGVEHRSAPIAANKVLKTIKTFMRWCV